MKIYIATCDAYDRLMKPFAYLFNKFWDSSLEVTMLSYRTPQFDLPENFNFISLGEKQISINHWSTDLRNFFETVDDDFFMLAAEDHFIYDYVNTDLLDRLKTKLHDNVGRVALTNDFQQNCTYETLESFDDFNISIAHQNSDCRFSVIWSIFNKKYLLERLKLGRTPWESEGHGCQESMNDGYEIISTTGQQVIHCAPSAIRRGNISAPLDFSFVNNKNRFLDESIIQEMINKKLISNERTIV